MIGLYYYNCIAMTMKNKIENYLFNRIYTSILGISISVFALGCNRTQKNGGNSESTISNPEKPIKIVTQEEATEGCNKLKDILNKLSASVEEFKKIAGADDDKSDEKARAIYEEKLNAGYSGINMQLKESQEALKCMFDLRNNLTRELNETNINCNNIQSRRNYIMEEIKKTVEGTKTLPKYLEEDIKKNNENMRSVGNRYGNFLMDINKFVQSSNSEQDSEIDHLNRFQEIIKHRSEVCDLHFTKSSNGNDSSEIDKRISELEKSQLSVESKVEELSASITTLLKKNSDLKNHILVGE